MAETYIPPKEIAPGVFTTGGTAYTGTLPNTQNFSDIQNLQTFNTPPVPTQNNAMGALTTLQNQFQQNALNSQNELNQGMGDIRSLFEQLSGQTGYRQGLESQYKLPEMTKEYRDLQALQTKQTADYLNAYNTAMSRASVGTIKSAEENQITRQHGIDALITGARIQSAQGNIEFANNLVKQAVDLKYEPIKQELEYKKELLSYLKTKASEDRTAALNIQLKKVEQQAQTEKEIQGMILNAQAAKAPQYLIDAAIKDGTTLGVAKILGQYSPETLKYELLKEQIKTEKAQQTKLYADSVVNKQKPLSGDAAKIVAIAGTLPTDIQKIKDKINNVGYENFLRGYILGTDRETVKLINSAADKVGRLRSGGAINKDEEKRFTGQFASRGDYAFGNSETAIAALDAIMNEANIIGGSVDPTGVYRAQTTTTPPNKFEKATGSIKQTFPGSSIVNLNSNGTLNFKLPTGK